MEGPSNNTNNLRFIGSKNKFRIPQSGANPNCYKSITVANNHGLVIVGCDDKTIKFVSINQFLDFSKTQGHPTITNLEQFSCVLPLTFKPTLLTVARQGYSSILFVSGTNEANNCPVIEVFDVDIKSSISRLELPSNYSGVEIIDYAWHPNYYDSIAALCTNQGHLIIASIHKQAKKIAIVYSNNQYRALTCCWSPKGKNLAVGMMNGSMIRMEPVVTSEGFSIKEVDKSLLTFTNPRMTPEHQLIKLRWINKTFLMSVHARVNDPNRRETIHSLITVKPGKPYVFWSNVCFESNSIIKYVVHLVNLTSIVVSASNATTEPAVIGADGQKSTDLTDWSSLSVEDEADKMELPLTSSHDETYTKGVTIAFSKGISQDNIERPVLLFHTSDGVICPFAAMHPADILKLPEFQQQAEIPYAAEKGILVSTQATLEQPPPPAQTPGPFSMSSGMLGFSDFTKPQDFSIPKSQDFSQAKQSQPFTFASISASLGDASKQSQPMTTLQTQPAATPAQQLNNQFGQSPLSATPPQSQSQPQVQQKQSSPLSPAQPAQPTAPPQSQPSQPSVPVSKLVDYNLAPEIEAIRKKMDLNSVSLSLLDEVNHLRNQFDEIRETHQLHNEALEAIKSDIDALDLGILENLYLVEVIKNRGTRKRSIDPAMTKKIETIKSALKTMSSKLDYLNNHVDTSWELVRRSKTPVRRLNTLDVIYKTLATNQKVIRNLKQRVQPMVEEAESVKPREETKKPVVREQDQSKLTIFREFLACRNEVPVRRPY